MSKFQATNCTVLHLCCTNDTNGNPRRPYAVYSLGETLAILEEGYLGAGALDEPWGRLVGDILRHRVAMDVNITPKEYRRLRTHRFTKPGVAA